MPQPIAGFDWDAGNRAKCRRLGVFTIRSQAGRGLIRPISARYMHAKEIAAYEKANPHLPE